MVMLIGVVVTLFAYFNPHEVPYHEAPNDVDRDRAGHGRA
jgi:hypothetical protein